MKVLQRVYTATADALNPGALAVTLVALAIVYGAAPAGHTIIRAAFLAVAAILAVLLAVLGLAVLVDAWRHRATG